MNDDRHPLEQRLRDTGGVGTSYWIPAGDGAAEIVDRGSRFLGRVRRVTSEEDAREVVAAARSEHRDARHHCSAFVLGPDGSAQRSNDDGEPSGTAGAPMLEVLRGRGVSDVVAVVTRYFGGVLLGAGGLVRAYGGAVSAALDDAGLRRRVLRHTLEVSIGHAGAGRLENDIRSAGLQIASIGYGSEVTVVVAVPPDECVDADQRIAAWTAGAARTTWVGTVWVDA